MNSTPDYDACIVLSLSENEASSDTDSESSFDTSSEESDENHPYSKEVSLINKRFSDTDCNINGSHDITPVDRIESENVSRAEGVCTKKITEEETTQSSHAGTSGTLKSCHSGNNIGENFRTGRCRKSKAYNKIKTERIPNIVIDLGNRQMHGRSSNSIPTEVFAKMKMLPSRITPSVTRITCALIDHKSENVILALEYNNIQVWNLKTFQPTELHTPVEFFESVTHLTLNPDGQILVAGTKYGNIIAYDLTLKTTFFKFGIHTTGIISMKFSPMILEEVSWLCTMDKLGIALWPFVERKNWTTKRYYVARLELNPNNEDFFLWSTHQRPRDLRVIELGDDYHSYLNSENCNTDNPSFPSTSKILRRREIFISKDVISFDFSPLGKYVVFACKDNSLNSYALQFPDCTPRVSHRGPSGQEHIVHIRWANTRRALISCQLLGCAVFRDTSKNMAKRNLEMPGYEPDWPLAAEWSCDDRLIFTIGIYNTICVWLTENLIILHKFKTEASIGSLLPNPIHPHILIVEFHNGGVILSNIGSSKNLWLDTFDVDKKFIEDTNFCKAKWSKDGTMLAAINTPEMNLTLFSLYLGIERIKIPYGKVSSDVGTPRLKNFLNTRSKRIKKLKTAEMLLNRNSDALSRYHRLQREQFREQFRPTRY